MKISTVSYLGELRTSATHLNSNTCIITDAPKDNRGKGEAFSPTDLLATCLASCMITVMGIYIQDNNLIVNSIEAEVDKTMAINPRRVSKIGVILNIVGQFTEEQKFKLKDLAMTCPVAESLDPQIELNIQFEFENA